MQTQTDSQQIEFSFKNLLLALCGHRESILRAVDCQRSMLLMPLLVASAAVCREYDGSSFVFAPIELLIPFVASLVIATLLFIVVIICRQLANCKPVEEGISFRRFLYGYWLTAPIAWLYALPIESMTDELTAVRVNLTLLSIVSIWRVLLFSRIAGVIYNLPTWIVLSWIGPVCAMIAAAAMFQNKLQMVGFMGGIRLTQSEELVLAFQHQAETVLGYLFWALVVSFFLSFGFLLRMRSQFLKVPLSHSSVVGRSVWISLSIVFLLLAAGSTYFQPKLFRSGWANWLVREGKCKEAGNYLGSFQRTDLPKGSFIKFPRIEPWGRNEQVVGRIRSVLDLNPPDWVAEQLLTRSLESLRNRIHLHSEVETIVEKDELLEIRDLVELLSKRGWIGTLTIEEIEILQSKIDLALKVHETPNN